MKCGPPAPSFHQSAGVDEAVAPRAIPRPLSRSARGVLAATLLLVSCTSVLAQGSSMRSRELGSDLGVGSATSEYMRMSPAQRAVDLSTEARQVRIGQQHGLGYLALMVMRQYRLVEKHASAANLGNIKVIWARYPSGKGMNDALQAGLVDFASGGVAPMLRAWDRTREADPVRGVAALSAMPMFLNTSNSAVRTVADFGPRDRIAVPAVRESIQAITLQMAAVVAFGPESYARLDELTVSMGHVDAMEVLLSGGTAISAHFASPPFQYQELEKASIKTVLSSYDILGNPTTFTAMWAAEGFRRHNPKLFGAVFAALREAMAIIQSDTANAAEVYLQHTRSSLSHAVIERIIGDSQVQYTVVPYGFMDYADFMYHTGSIRARPRNWQELFFEALHPFAGS